MARRRRFTAQAPLINSHDVPIRGLDPVHDGVRIAHMSDLHVGNLTGRKRIQQAVGLANETAADLLVMTGDYVCYSRREVALMREQLAGLRAPRVLVVLGNHDYYCGGEDVAIAMEHNGYTVLRNRAETIEIRGRPLHVIGVDDPVTRRHDLDAAFRDVPDHGTRVVLCHGPELADRISDRGAHLILSGHTHGGQIFVRGITDRIVGKLGMRYRSGFYEVEGATLYVSAGVGSSSVPVRVGQGTRAEVAVHTLRAA
jgi:predicted MPP superfamily phosphohydrolase